MLFADTYSMRPGAASWVATVILLLLLLQGCPGCKAHAAYSSIRLQPTHLLQLHSLQTLASSRTLLQSKKYALSVDPDNKGCYMYRATSGDTVEQIASNLKVDLADLKDRNSKNIADWSRLNGRFIQICNVGNMAATEGVNGGSAPTLSASAPAQPPAAPKEEPKAEPKAETKPAPAPAPAPAPEATPTQTPVSVSVPQLTAPTDNQDYTQYCKTCPDCVKCKDCAVCASATTVCFLNGLRAACATCKDCRNCPSTGDKPMEAYESCGACAACSECCRNIYSLCTSCSYCQYCKYCKFCTQ